MDAAPTANAGAILMAAIRKFKGVAKIIQAVSISAVWKGAVRKASVTNPDDFPTTKGLLVLHIDPAYEQLMRRWIEAYQNQKDYPGSEIDIELKFKSKARSMDQNNLYWALITILAQEIYGQHGWEEEVHEAMLSLYAPRIKSKVHGTEIPKRSKDMDSREMTQLIEGVIAEINEAGVNFTEMADFDRYWQEYNKLRFSGGSDNGYRDDESLEQYRYRVNYCEACRKYLRPGTGGYDGQLAHIVSRGTMGEDATWNILHLCARDHTGTQHQHGWDEFLERYPHLIRKVEMAREKHASLRKHNEDEGVLDIF
jgi:hypothetical protein